MKKGLCKELGVAVVTLSIFLSGCGTGGSPSKTTNENNNSTTSSAISETSTSTTEKTSSNTGTTLGITPLPERQTLRIGFFAGSAHSCPWYIADKMGFFNEENIDVEYSSFTAGPAMMEASADWDVADAGAPGALNGMKNYNINMIGISDNEYNTALFVRPNTDLAKDPQDPENWRGKEVLLNKGTTLQYMFMQYMKKIGITDLNAYDITITDTAVGTCLTAFESGQGDAMCVWNAFAISAEDDGDVRVADIKTLGLNNISTICATSDAIANHEDLVKTAYETYYKTWEWAKKSDENMKKAVELFMDSCDDEGVSVTEDSAKRLLEEYNCPTFNDAIDEMTTKEEDRNGKGGKVTKAENMLFETLDFFISLGNYTEEDRQNIIDKNLVNPVIAESFR